MLSIIVRFSKHVMHHWPDAHEKRSYLLHPHRHQMRVEVEFEVRHTDREIEFHDFQEFCTDAFEGGYVGAKSCEDMALELAKKVRDEYGDEGFLTVSVFEDGEVGAKAYYK